MRIVSLLPSATEIVCAIGLGDRLVGVTHECDYPSFVRSLPKVTRTLIPTAASSGEIDRLVRDRLGATRALYTLDRAVLQQLEPDLIVTQALCDVCAVAEAEVRDAACRLPGAPRVVNLEPETLEGVFDAIALVGAAADAAAAAAAATSGLRARVAAVADRMPSSVERPRVALLEWLDPPFSAGHWNPELVRLAGGVDGLGREGSRSRTLQWQEVIDWQPEVVLIACCGFDVDRTMADVPALWAVPGWDSLPAVRAGRCYVADGAAYFSRPGPRLVDSLELLAHVIDPACHPLPDGVPAPLALREPPVVDSAAGRRAAR